jgi:hypothetical protein
VKKLRRNGFQSVLKTGFYKGKTYYYLLLSILRTAAKNQGEPAKTKSFSDFKDAILI